MEFAEWIGSGLDQLRLGRLRTGNEFYNVVSVALGDDPRLAAYMNSGKPQARAESKSTPDPVSGREEPRGIIRCVTSKWARAACSDSALRGISKEHLGALIAQLAGPWEAARESELAERRGHSRMRAAGGGPDHRLVFVDRVLVALVALR